MSFTDNLKKEIFKIPKIINRYGWASPLVFIILILLFYWTTFYSELPSLLFSKVNSLRGEYAKFLVPVLGGFLVFYGLLLNQRRTKALEDQNELTRQGQENERNRVLEQNELTRKGQVNERFKNAIEHLGSNNNTAIILGGIYALHHIASDEPYYRKTVFDILCSYIRSNTSSLKTWNELSENERESIKPDIVIQTIIDLLFKTSDIETDDRFIYKGLKSNLSETKCLKYNFNNANLKRADLRDSDFSGSNFTDANLYEANLMRSNFQDVHLKRAILGKAIITRAHMEFSNLESAYLKEAILVSVHMEFSSLKGAKMQGANLYKAHLEGSSLQSSFLIGANLKAANLVGANLTVAHLEGANLQQAQLQGAYSCDAHFEGSSLVFTDFSGALVSRAHFEGAYSLDSPKSSLKEWIRERMNQGSDLSNVKAGFLDNIKATKLINEQRKWEREDDISNFVSNLENGVNIDTDIKNEAITGILTQEMANEIIKMYQADTLESTGEYK